MTSPVINFLWDTLYRDSGDTYYYRLINRETGKTWNNSSEALEASPSWADSAISITEDPSSQGKYPVIIPETLPEDNYDLIIYKQAGGTPAETDIPDKDSGYWLKWGSIFGF